MATVQPWTPNMNDKTWTDEEKEQWLAAHGDTPTHVVTFEPMYQIELCIPPWEAPDRQISRSAVAWGTNMCHVLEEGRFGSARVVAAHHEANSLEVYHATTPRPRLHRVT
jgi:hypothetical protein